MSISPPHFHPPHFLADLLHRRPWTASLIPILLTLLALPIVVGVEVDNSLEVWLDRDGEPYADYQDFRADFGSEEYILVIYEAPEIIDHDFLMRLTDLRFELEEIGGVERIDDLAQVFSRLYSLRGIEAFRRDLEASPFLHNFLISKDGEWAATWIDLEVEKPEMRAAVVTAIEAAVELAPPADAVHLAGSPYLNAELDRASQRAARTFFPIVFALSALALLLVFRRSSGVVIPFLSVGAAIAWTLALMRLGGDSLDMVTVALPPLVWVLGLSTSIHLLARRDRYIMEGAEPREATRRAMAELAKPCLMSAVTTAFGFASLLASSMDPVREMGLYAAIGILLSLVSNFLLFPLLTDMARSSRDSAAHVERREALAHPILDAFAHFAERHPRPVLIVTAVVLLGLGYEIVFLRAESNPVEFFHDDAPISVTYERILPEFTGPYSVEIVVEPPLAAASGRHPDLASLERLDALARRLESHDGLARVISVVDFVRRAEQERRGGEPESYALPGDDEALTEIWQRLEEDFPSELHAFVRNGKWRLSALAQPMNTKRNRELMEKLLADVEASIPAEWRPRVTGIVPLLVDMQDRLVESQIRTFAAAALLIGLLMGALLKRLDYALLAIGPNLLPVVVALGAMGLFDIPLDPATVMIAGIALGIAVDDTIHYLVAYRRQRAAGVERETAVIEALHGVGRPMVITSVVAALGFMALALSPFVPLLYFGLLTAVALMTALVGDLLVLPALLMVLPKRR